LKLIVYENDLRRKMGIPKFKAPKDGDAGYDLHACEGEIIRHAQVKVFRTGLHIVIPKGYVGIIMDRSGTGSKGIKTFSALYLDSDIVPLGQVIDSSYRGEIGVALCNLSEAPYLVRPGDRIGQLLILPSFTPEVHYVNSEDELPKSERGNKGFGSSGR